MLGNVYIVGKVFHIFQFLCCIQKNPSHIISKWLGRKDFPMEQLPIDSYMLLCKQKNSIPITHKSLVYIYCLYILYINIVYMYYKRGQNLKKGRGGRQYREGVFIK